MKIALTYTGSDSKHANYCNWLKQNTDVEIETFSAELDNLSLLDECDALVLSGGIDIHPETYHSSHLNYPFAPDSFNLKRDKFEISLFNKALNMNLPILGICRGMQLINVAMGGTMKQDLGKLNSVHKASDNDKVHPVVIKETSLLHETIKQSELPANSAHHQALDAIAEELIVNACSKDNVPEGIEWKERSGKAFMLGIQWHPERMDKVGLSNSPLSVLIRETFINEVKKSVSKK